MNIYKQRICRTYALAVLVINGLLMASSVADQEEKAATGAEVTGTQVLFNGTDLDGWSGDDRFWSVEDGVIVGQTTSENPTERNTFLIWKGGDVSDFELRLKYRMEGGNSGVQVRSTDLGDHSVSGYQADMDAGNNYTGIWYEERGRGILVPRCKEVTIDADGERSTADGVVDEATYVAALKSDDWNEIVLTAKGNRLTHSINGNVSAVLVDSQEGKATASGILALQLHAGPPMKIMFKDIELTALE